MTMAFSLFGKKSGQNSIDYKSRLEYKLYLARENPEPIFDLSECNLNTVPSGIYSLCRVFRKEKLFLQVNQLTSISGGGQLSDLNLLTVLDLHNNKLPGLPEDIRHLTNLLELIVSHNELKKLPEGLGNLAQLQVLDCSHNRLKCMPQSIAALKRLIKLDIRGNPQLCRLPDLNTATTLEQLLADKQQFTTSLPPTATNQRNNSSHVYEKIALPAQLQDNYCEKEISVDPAPFQHQGSFKVWEKKKEEKLKELLKVERKLQEQKGKEYTLHVNMKQDKTKLITSLKEQQRKLEEDVSKFHTQKEQERTRLLNHLLEVESRAEERITDLLVLNQALRQSSEWQEQDQRDQQLLVDCNIRTSQLRRQDVIDAMESLLAEECARKEKLLDYEKSKAQVIQSSLLREVEWGEQMTDLLSERDTRQSALVSTVEADSQLQKALVATLLERSDMRTQTLIMQVALVQQQLAVLTAVELQRRHIHSHQHLNELADKRQTLSELLTGLLKEQEERRKQLIHTLHQMDYDREKEMCESSSDYWLSQYQRLLELRPRQLRATVDPGLVHQLVQAGVAHCLPFMSFCDPHKLTDAQLYQIGITNKEDRVAIMTAVTAYLSHKQDPVDEQFLPSAPPDDLPSAPPLSSSGPLSECVVCMELECAVVFVPCGHLCTCVDCASKLSSCPLCRVSLERKIQVIVP